MSFYDKSEESFVKRIMDLKVRAENNGTFSLLKFLDVRQQKLVAYIIGNNSAATYSFYGGYEGSEYQKCMIYPKGDYEIDYKIDVLELIYNRRYLNPHHRMILGALMSLGIKREVIGDIIVGERTYIICSSEITQFLKNEFRTLSGIPVSLEKVQNIHVESLNEYEVKHCIISSLRMDVVISARYNLSRNRTKELIEAGHVKLNQVIQMNPAFLLKAEDCLSIKGFGRMKVISIGDKTRKDRIKVEIGKMR